MTDSNLLDQVSKAWGWCGIEPVKLIDQNRFGNLLIADRRGIVWRLCPEDIYCREIAASEVELAKLRTDGQFQVDWQMDRLAEGAIAALGELEPGRCFCLKIPGPLGGGYDMANVGTIRIAELISFSGDVGRQIRDLPDGSKIEFRIVD